MNECEHLKYYMALDENCEILPALYRKIISDNLTSVFSDVKIALRVFMCTRVTNCARERSFSRLNLMKKPASQHNEAAAQELAFTRVYGK